MQGKISDHEAKEIKSKLMMGQSENYKLDSFLASLRMEIEPLMYVSKRGKYPLNIVTALKHNAIMRHILGLRLIRSARQSQQMTFMQWSVVMKMLSQLL